MRPRSKQRCHATSKIFYCKCSERNAIDQLNFKENICARLANKIINSFLSAAGYETAITTKKLQKDDIMALQEFARSIPQYITNVAAENKIVLTKNQQDKILKLFLGFYSSTPTEFRFKPGEIVLIDKIVNSVYSTLALNNNMYDVPNNLLNSQKSLSNSLVQTSVGLLFNVEQIDTIERISNISGNKDSSSQSSRANNSDRRTDHPVDRVISISSNKTVDGMKLHFHFSYLRTHNRLNFIKSY